MILDDDYWSLCTQPLTFLVMLLLVLLWPAVTHVTALVQWKVSTAGVTFFSLFHYLTLQAPQKAVVTPDVMI